MHDEADRGDSRSPVGHESACHAILRPGQRTGALMTSSALFAFLHHAAAFLLVAVVMVAYTVLLRRTARWLQ